MATRDAAILASSLPGSPGLAFRVASQDAELVALGIGEHEPPRAVGLTPVIEGRGPQGEEIERVRSVGTKSKWTRFFTCLSSGTSMNKTCWPPAGSMIMHSTWPGSFGSPGTSVNPNTLAQNTDSAYASWQSNVVWSIREVIGPETSAFVYPT